MLKYIVICISIFIIFFLGIYVGSAEIFPYEILKSLKNQVDVTLYDSKKDVISRFNPELLIKLENRDDIFMKKTELKNYIWKQNELPNNVPIEMGVTEDGFYNFENLERIDILEVKMEHDLNSIIYVFHPTENNKKLIIYHQGHSGGFNNGKTTIGKFVDSGYTVAALSMPLIGMNNQPIIDIKNIGPIKMQKHGQFEFLKTNEFSPLKYFFEPINQTLNYFDKNFEFSEYNMIGISGGGWTATVYPAIDDRISNSFAISGSIPLPLRYLIQDIGDWEQNNIHMLNISNYLELYIMSSFGENREFVQIFNRYDPCCFGGTPFELYENEVKRNLQKIGPGEFSVYLDESHREHKISKEVVDVVLEKLKDD